MDVSRSDKFADKLILIQDFRRYASAKIEEAQGDRDGTENEALACAVLSSVNRVERTIERFGHPTAKGYEASLATVAKRARREAASRYIWARNMKMLALFGVLLFVSGLVLGWNAGFDLRAAGLAAFGFGSAFFGFMGNEHFQFGADKLKKDSDRVVTWDQAVMASRTKQSP